MTLVGEIAPQLRFAGTVSVRLTVPANPLTAVTVMVDVAETPALTAAGLDAAIVKSTTWKVAVVEWLKVPLVPVIESVYVAAMVELQATVAVPELVTLVGEIAPQLRFAGTVSVSETVPVKPLTADTVIVEVADTPTLTAAGELAVIAKSVTVNVAVKL